MRFFPDALGFRGAPTMENHTTEAKYPDVTKRGARLFAGLVSGSWHGLRDPDPSLISRRQKGKGGQPRKAADRLL